ncbi:MAG: sensor histidine kinase [Cytophagia bacterium]|nr:sensor histidine kinase [Cytophagia bacterium]
MKTILTCMLLISLIPPGESQSVKAVKQEPDGKTLSVADSIELLNTISRSLTFVNQTKSLEAANRALKLSLDTDNAVGMAYAYRNLSSLHSYNESYSISMEYIQRALDIFEGLADSAGIANCYISLGHESYFNAGDYRNGRLLTDYAITINDSLQNKPVLSSCYKVMGLIELAEGKYDVAKNYFEKVLVLSSELGENSQKIATAESLFSLATIFKIKQARDEQLAYLLRTADFSLQHGLANYLQRTYQELILYSANRNDQQAVIKYINSYASIIDSLDQVQLADRYALANNIIQVHKLSKAKEELEKVSVLQAQEIESRNTILIVILISVLILIWLLLKFVRLNKKLQTQNIVIAEQNADLEILNTTKDKFFSIVAHDLKSPLNSLKSFSALLINHYDMLGKDEILDMSKKLQLAVDNTIKMADNLITWAKIQMNELQYSHEVFNLNQIGANVYGVYKEVADKKGVELLYSIEDSIKVAGDKNQIEFIIRNLVNNAIKFSKQGGVVSISATQLPSGQVEIAVADNGVGIPAEVKQRLFTIGKKQSTNGTAGEKGTGLGLMLSYEFVKMNKGEMVVESEEGKGSEFKIIIQGDTAVYKV